MIFSLELEMSGVAVQSTHQNSEMTTFTRNCSVKMTFEAVLATFRCYNHGAKVSEEVQKIDTDQKEYCKCSLCVIIC